VVTHKHSIAWSMVALLGLWAAPSLTSILLSWKSRETKQACT
jgi:hypothetical protein